MKKAIVELRGCISYSHRDRIFRKDQPQTVTDEAVINQLVGTGLFSVRFLEEEARPAAKAEPALAAEPAPAREEAAAPPPPPPKAEPKKAAPPPKKQRRGLFK